MGYAIFWLCAICTTVFFQNVNSLYYKRNYINTYLTEREKPADLRSASLIQYYWHLLHPHYKYRQSTFFKVPIMEETGSHYLNARIPGEEKKSYPQSFMNRNPKVPSLLKSYLYFPYSGQLFNPYFVRLKHSNRELCSETRSGKMVPDMTNHCFPKYGVLKKTISIPKYYIKGRTMYEPNREIPHLTKFAERLIVPSKILISNLSSWNDVRKNENQSHNLSLSMVYNMPLPKIGTTTINVSLISHNKQSTANPLQGNGIENVTNFMLTPKINQISFNRNNRNFMQTTSAFKLESSKLLGESTVKNDRYQEEYQYEYQAKKGSLFTKKICMTTAIFKDIFRCNTDKVLPWKEITSTPIIFTFDDYFCECHECKRTIQPTNKHRKEKMMSKKNKMKLKVNKKNNLLAMKQGSNNIQNDFITSNNSNITLMPRNILKYATALTILDTTEKNEIEEKIFNVPYKVSCTTDDKKVISIENSRFKRRTFKCRTNNKRKRAFVSAQTFVSDENKKNAGTLKKISNLKKNYLQQKRLRKYKKKQHHINEENLQKDCKNIPQIYPKPKMYFKKIKNKTWQDKGAFVNDIQDNIDYTNYCEDLSEQMSTSRKYPENSEKESMNYPDTSETESMIYPENPESDSTITSSQEQDNTSFKVTITTVTKLNESTADTEETDESTAIAEETDESTAIAEETDESTAIVEETDESSPYTEHYDELTIVEVTDKSINLETSKGSTERFMPETGNRHPAKLLCEKEHKVHCMCHIASVLTEFNNVIATYDDPKLLLQQLKSYNCNDYIPIKDNYKISPESKPRLISNKHKELLVDEENGPKEIRKQTFEELMVYEISNEGVDFYVFPSANVEIPCFINGDVQLSPTTATYVWRQGDNKVIRDGRVTEDLNHRGKLRIVDATLADSDNYTCTVKFKNPDEEQVMSNNFVHSVNVVTLPKFALHTLLHYKAKAKCDQEILEMLDLYLPQQIEELICYVERDKRKICSIEIHNPMCHPKKLKVKNEVSKSVWKLLNTRSGEDVHSPQENEENLVEMSLNFELDMGDIGQTMPSAANRTRCGPFCQLKVVLKVIEILRDSFTMALANEVSSSLGPIFEPDTKTINMKVLIACEGGFRLLQGFCFPCPANTYSEEGSTDCSECPSGTFQPKIGSKSCENCTTPFKTGCAALWMSPKVIGLLVLFIILVVIVSLLLFYGCKMIFGSLVYSFFFKILRKEKRRKPRESLMRKHSKRSSLKSRVKYEDTSDPPTPPEEDFTS